MQTLRIKIEVPQTKKEPWKVVAKSGGRAYPSKKKTVGVAYAFVERKLKDFFKE